MSLSKNVSPFKLVAADSRLTTLPIVRRPLFDYYQDAYKCFWTVEEISLSKDIEHFETRLTPGEKRFVKHVLAFFAASDGIVNLNLAKRFKKDVGMLEAGYFYDFQIAMENIHAHMYSLLLDTLVSAKERDELLNAIHTIPVIKKMADFMFKCIDSDAPFAERLLRMACVEGIFFTGCFCAIYWLQNRGLMPGLGHSNELIARDEALHTMFAMFLYTMIEPEHRLSFDRVKEIVGEAVTLAKAFIADALPNGLAEMNAQLMGDYIECQADNLVTLIDFPVIFGSKHDFHFMEQINLQNRTNFFERRVSEYSKAQSVETTDFEIKTDF
jgi:ribonucleotide reductase beta subunit family protein with ferritin-like domain